MKATAMIRTRALLSAGIALVFLTLATGCGSNTALTADQAGTAITKAGIAADYADIVYALYSDAYDATVDLQTAIDDFVANPNSTTFEAAKTAWITARVYYSQTEGFRFYNGPIDASPADIELRINSWPIDEVYIDYTQAEPSGGIINNTTEYPTFNVASLKDANGVDGDTNISTGYHAIEFLLWGQDLSSGPGGGGRPYTDYLSVGGTASNQRRRGDYLKIVTAALLEDLKIIRDTWAPNGTYRTEWMKMDPTTRLSNMLNGIATLAGGELAKERIGSAMETEDKEEEQSCFSDNTRNDIIDNIKSVQAVYVGKITRYGGGTLKVRGLYDLALTVNPALANQIKADIEGALLAATNVQDPFDQEFISSNSEGRARLETLVSKLTDTGTDLSTLSVKLTGSGVVGDGD